MLSEMRAGKVIKTLWAKHLIFILSPQGVSSPCKSMEWDMRYNEAENRSGLHVSDVA